MQRSNDALLRNLSLNETVVVDRREKQASLNHETVIAALTAEAAPPIACAQQ
jgi:hypothetical protein